MDFKEKDIASKLQKYPENKLTNEIIIPLLHKIGYQKVEFFGGPSEEGKDIVIWHKDEFDDLKLIVAQVKHFKFTNKASDGRSFQTVVNQLITSLAKSLPYTDKTEHLPYEVILISSHEVDTKTLLTRFSLQPNLKDQRIKIIDGIKLASLLIKHEPNIVKELFGINVEIAAKLRPTLDNRILLTALGTHREKDIMSIYTDIDISIGKITTNLFFNSQLIPTEHKKIDLTKNEWDSLKVICNEIKVEFPLTFLLESIETIEERNKQTTIEFSIWKEKYDQLVEQLRNDKIDLDTSQKERNDQIKKIALIEDSIRKGEINYPISVKILEEKYLQKLKEKIDKLEQNFMFKSDELKILKKNEAKFQYSVHINGIELANEIMNKRTWIEKKLKEYNTSKPNPAELKVFIEKCTSIIDQASKIFDEKNAKFFSSIGYDNKKVIRAEFESTRFKLSIDQVFDTGLNIAVFGEAGAGKSTSLEVYAYNNHNTDKIVILAPLGYVFQNSGKNASKLTFEVDNFSLDEKIFEYLVYMGIQISLSEFRSILSKEKVVLLLDGLDEAIKFAPWLPNGIRLLSEKYKNSVQVIVTSRMYGQYLDEIPFFAVTLLPFTLEQRDSFIEKWFEYEGKKRIITNKIKKHLNINKELSDIIRNPLLTTTLCVLAEHNLPLPKTEIKLYDERIKLFTGYYDNVKHIITRISNTPNTLEKLAQKIAFYLHSQNRREDFKNILEEQSIRIMTNQLSQIEAKTTLNELIDPCEILVPMSPDGKYGFGHLRYQEHLAALELFNPSININVIDKATMVEQCFNPFRTHE